MLEVVTTKALAAEEERSLVLVLGCKFSKGCSRTLQLKSAKLIHTKCSSFSSTASVQGYSSVQGYCYSYIGSLRETQEATLSQATQILKLQSPVSKLSKFVQLWSNINSSLAQFQEEDTTTIILRRYLLADQDAAVPPDVEKEKYGTLEELILRRKKASNEKMEKQKNRFDTTSKISADMTKRFDLSGPIQSSTYHQHRKRCNKALSRKRKATITEAQPSKKPKLRSETIDELRNYLRVVDFEKNAQDKESLEGISMITELQVIDSPDGEYLIIHRANNHFRAFDTLWEILHVLDRQDLYHLYRVVDDYYEHIPPTGLGLSLLGDLNIIWETAESSDDDFWKDQEEWEIIRWRCS
ncbi:hypothetical protein Tco_0822328 [Tanacetum coccineum]|uniref:Uncharacterized protein n=1 Tax=Tanacetum coccineum TaxID=301880 RepID=A0ABQ5AGJ2_9ASTR